jgi:hypothetical protein
VKVDSRLDFLPKKRHTLNMKTGFYYRTDDDYGFYFYDEDEDRFIWLGQEGQEACGITDFDKKSFKDKQMVFVAPNFDAFIKTIAPYLEKQPKPPIWAGYLARNV